MINKSIDQVIVVLRLTFKRVWRSFAEAYNIVVRRLKLSNKTPLHHKIVIAFVDNTGLINYGSDIEMVFELLKYDSNIFSVFQKLKVA